jgi:hypothetical protein
MIELKDLYGLVSENEQKIIELQAENRVLNKLIDIEKSKEIEVAQPCEEVIVETEQQDESY